MAQPRWPWVRRNSGDLRLARRDRLEDRLDPAGPDDAGLELERAWIVLIILVASIVGVSRCVNCAGEHVSIIASAIRSPSSVRAPD